MLTAFIESKVKRFCEMIKMKKSISSPVSPRSNQRGTTNPKVSEEKPRKSKSLNAFPVRTSLGSNSLKTVNVQKLQKNDFSNSVKGNKVFPLERDSCKKVRVSILYDFTD